MEISINLPPDTAKCEEVTLMVDEGTSVKDIKETIVSAEGCVGGTSARQLRAYHQGRALSNREKVFNKPVIELELPSKEMSIRFFDPNTELHLTLRMGIDCPISAAIRKWYHPFDEPVSFSVRGVMVSPASTPRQIGWLKFEERLIVINSGRGILI